MPVFHVVDFVASVPAFVVTCPDDVLGGVVALVLILAVRRLTTSDHGGSGRIFW